MTAEYKATDCEGCPPQCGLLDGLRPQDCACDCHDCYDGLTGYESIRCGDCDSECCNGQCGVERNYAEECEDYENL